MCLEQLANCLIVIFYVTCEVFNGRFYFCCDWFVLQMPPRKVRKTAATPTAGARGQSTRVQTGARWDPQYPRLSQQAQGIRSAIYESTHPEKCLLFEHTVIRSSLAGYNVVETFDQYGWCGVLDFDPKQTYVEIVREWMRTLRRVDVPGHLELLRLVGSYREQEVEMTVARIRELFGMDTGYYLHEQSTPYQCIDLRAPTSEIDPTHLLATLYRADSRSFDSLSELLPLPRALQRIIIENVNPRSSDHAKVRKQDAFVLYALMTGRIFMSFAYNAMCNIWHAYDTRGLKITPHAVLISRYVAHHLANRVRVPQPLSRTYIIQATPLCFRGIVFEHPDHRYMIRDTSSGQVYTAPGGVGHEEEPPVQGGYGDQPHQYGVGAQPEWFTTYAQERRSWEQGMDTAISDLSATLARLDTRDSQHYALTRQHVYDEEYYRYMDYERYRSQQRDPMEIDFPRPAAPLHYRAGPSYDPPPVSEYQQYQVPPE